jgi:hypothetical protein
MASCLITAGLIADCEALRRIGGANLRFWVFNIAQVNKALGTKGYTMTSDYISAINWTTYGGLYRYETNKKSQSGGHTVKSQAGGNTFYNHDVILKLFPVTPVDDQAIEELDVGNVGIILETSNSEFFMFGGYNGMEVTEGTQNSGQEAESDTATIRTLVGEERELPKRILATDYATTLALLESYEL